MDKNLLGQNKIMKHFQTVSLFSNYRVFTLVVGQLVVVHCSVTRYQNKKVPNVNLKRNVFQNSPKVTEYLGYFDQKILPILTTSLASYGNKNTSSIVPTNIKLAIISSIIVRYKFGLIFHIISPNYLSRLLPP